MKPDAAQSQECVLERRFPADLDEAESYIVDMLTVLRSCGLECVCFDLELMAREMLANAVRHGCKDDATQSVNARLSVTPGRVELCVSDSGSGFDWRGAPTCLPDPDCETGRGLCILHCYANSVKFNDSGNAVCVTKLLPSEEEEMSEDRDGSVRIALEPNISAKNVQALRELFKQHLNNGAHSMVLDFSQVESIDSVGIGLLVATHNSLTKAGGCLSLVNVSHDIYQLFTLMRLEKHFGISRAGAEG